APVAGSIASVNVNVVLGRPFARQISSPPPGPTGNAFTRPRRTADEVAPDARFQAITAAAPLFVTRTPVSTSAGAGAGVPEQEPAVQMSPDVQLLPSLHAVP